MTGPIARFVNRTVLVSIPALFSDGACRPYKLLGIELNGLWLQSDDLTQRLLADETADYPAAEPAVFVPFAQIAGVMVPTTLMAPPPPGAEATAATGNAAAADSPAAKRRRGTGKRAPGSGDAQDERQPEA
jgi:hypothetical protein